MYLQLFKKKNRKYLYFVQVLGILASNSQDGCTLGRLALATLTQYHFLTHALALKKP